jgi:hypothetical protein
MTVDKLKRVLWRLRKEIGTRTLVRRKELRRAIMIECGTSTSTYYVNRDALLAIGWLKRVNCKFRITGLDLTEDF